MYQYTSEDPDNWTVEDVIAWLKSTGQKQDICDIFAKHDVDARVLATLNRKNLLSDLEIQSYGARITIENGISRLFPDNEHIIHHPVAGMEISPSSSGDGILSDSDGRGGLSSASQKHSTSYMIDEGDHVPKKQRTGPVSSWLTELHEKLWGRTDLQDTIFRTVILDKDDFIKLQSQLALAPTQSTKSDFLRSMQMMDDHSLLLEPPNDLDDLTECNDDPLCLSELSEFSSDLLPAVTPNSISPESAGTLAEILEVVPSFFPCKLRYMDLTCLGLIHTPRVPLLMLVRSEWDFLSQMVTSRTKGIEGSMVVTGQPGIGKTCFLYYTLAIRIINAQHTVFQDEYGSVFLITDQVRDEGFVAGDNVLALVDADGDKCQPSKEILNNRNYRVLLTSSPRASTDRKWMVQHCLFGQVMVMEPCSRTEVLQIMIFLLERNIPFKQLLAAANVCGFIPRRCLRAAVSAEALEVAKADIVKAITTLEEVEYVLRDVSGDRHFPHRVFEIYPALHTRAFELCLVRPVSEWAFDKLMIKAKQRDKDEAYRFYLRTQGSTHAATVRGLTWEWHVHRYFLSIEKPTALRLVSLDDQTTKEIKFPPSISHNDFGPNQIFEGQLVSSVRDGKSCYLRPLAKNFATLDSVLYLHDTSCAGFQPLFGLQITNSNKRAAISVKGLATLQKSLKLHVPELKALRPSRSQKWPIIFVVPSQTGTMFVKQNFRQECGEHWGTKTAQYVLELDERTVFGQV